jgi:hypothetical protein
MKTTALSTEAVWRERVRAWRASGQTAAQYAHEHGLSVASLRTWSSRLQRAEPPQFVQLVPRTPPARAPTPEAPTLLLEIAGARLRVAPGFDPALLAEVVRALATEAP